MDLGFRFPRVTASAWLNDLRNQIERTRILRSFYRSASALGSRLPSMAAAKATVAGAGAILRPVSSGTQVVMKRAQGMAQAAWAHPGLNFSTWSCMRPRHRANPSKPDDSADLLSASYKTATTTTIIAETQPCTSLTSEWSAEIDYLSSADPTEAGAEIMENNGNEDGMTEAELWQQLEQGLYSDQGGERAAITEVEAVAGAEMGARVGSDGAGCSTSGGCEMEKEVHRFYPPGKIIHVVTLVRGEEEEEGVGRETRAGVFLTRRLLYNKLRLSQTMISDHFMPAYQRQMERAIAELELERHTLVVPVSGGN